MATVAASPDNWPTPAKVRFTPVEVVRVMGLTRAETVDPVTLKVTLSVAETPLPWAVTCPVYVPGFRLAALAVNVMGADWPGARVLLPELVTLSQSWSARR